MTAPDGRRWRVRRLLLPRLRGRPSLDRLGEGGPILDDAWAEGLAGIALIVLAGLVLVFLPYIFFALELLVLPLYRIARSLEIGERLELSSAHL